MKKITWLLFFIFTSGGVFSQIQQNPFQKTDNAAKNLSSNKSKSIGELSEFINSNFNSDLEKARFIYAWIAGHIRYDVDCFLGKNSNLQDVSTVFRFKQGVCSGYANLFVELCKQCKITCTRIDGTCAKNYTSNHSWNAIKINGTWRLIDVTWGAGGVNDANVFIPQFNDQYFQVPPEIFILDHFPDDPMWQLLYQPITSPDFSAKNFSGISLIPVDTFHFNDTISHFFSLDSLHREYDFFRRSFAFNPGSDFLKEGRIGTLMAHSDQFLTNGDVCFNRYYKVKQSAFELPDSFELSEGRIHLLLDCVDTNYNRANSIYITLPHSNDSYNQSAINNNKAVISQRLYYLETEKEFIAAYFSAAKQKRSIVLQSYPQLIQLSEKE